MSDRALLIEKSESGGVVVFSLKGRVEALSAPRVRDALVASARDGKPRMVVDMAAVEFVDSAGFGAFIAALTALQQHQGVIAFAALGSNVDRTFRLIRLDRIFTVHPSVEAAVAALSR